MPELPEVEVVRRGLKATVADCVVRNVQIRQHSLRWPVTSSLPGLLGGRRLIRIGRRSKYLLLDFGAGTLIVHLGMTGNFRFVPTGTVPARHDHIDLVFDHGVLRYSDPRRFGAVLWHDHGIGPVSEHKLLRDLGPEPLSEAFTPQVLHRATRGRKVSIKQLLLSGRAVVGVGNIYASESLFRAGVRPGRAAGRLTRPACERLHAAIVQTLTDAIGQGGTTLRDFAGADGDGGYFQLSCRVYGREGQPCKTCANPIKRTVQQQRASYWCGVCQR